MDTQGKSIKDGIRLIPEPTYQHTKNMSLSSTQASEVYHSSHPNTRKDVEQDLSFVANKADVQRKKLGVVLEQKELNHTELAQEQFLVALKHHKYRKDTVEIPEEWQHDLPFLSNIANLKNVGVIGLPQEIRNRKDFILFHCQREGAFLVRALDEQAFFDLEIVKALLRVNGSTYRNLPETMKLEEEVIDAAIASNHHIFRDVPKEKLSAKKIKQWAQHNEEILAKYKDFPEEAKQDPILVEACLRSRKNRGISLNHILPCLRENEQVMAALIESSEAIYSIFEKLPSAMQDSQLVQLSFLKATKEEVEKKRKLLESIHEASVVKKERVVRIEEIHPDIRWYLEANMDGVRFGRLSSKSKKQKGFISELEVLSHIHSILSSHSISPKLVMIVARLKKALRTIRKVGKNVRVVQHEKQRTNEKLGLQELSELTSLIYSNFHPKQKQEVVEKIVAANRKYNFLTTIPNELKLALYGFLKKDAKRLNHALRSGEADTFQQLYIDGLAEGLQHLPSTTGTVWCKGPSLSRFSTTNYETGMMLTERGFIQATTENIILSKEELWFCIQLQNKASLCKNIHYFTFATDEDVVFLSGAKFRVLAQEKNIVFLKEVFA